MILRGRLFTVGVMAGLLSWNEKYKMQNWGTEFKFGFIGAINPSEIRFQRMKSSRGEDEIRLRRMKSALRAGCGTDPSGLFIKIQF